MRRSRDARKSEVAEQTLYDLPYTRLRAAVLLLRLRESSVVVSSVVNSCVMITLRAAKPTSKISCLPISPPESRADQNILFSTETPDGTAQTPDKHDTPEIACKRNEPCLANTLSPGPAPVVPFPLYSVSPHPISSGFLDAVGKPASHIPSWVAVTLVKLSRRREPGTRLADKRQRHRQSGLLRLGQTAQLLNVNLILIIFLGREDDREIGRRVEMGKVNEIYTLNRKKKIEQFIHSEM
jgi:hypothetical protein